MRKSLITKKAINELVRAKDTETIIKLYELEQKQNPLDVYRLNEYCTGLTHCQKEAAKDYIKKGLNFGLPQELFYELKEFFGFGRITRNEKGEKFFIEYRERQTDLVYPF